MLSELLRPAGPELARRWLASLLLVLDGNWSGVPSALTTLLALSVFGPGPVALMVWWLQRDEASRRAISLARILVVTCYFLRVHLLDHRFELITERLGCDTEILEHSQGFR